ncbi:7140_t:CDS:2, partial [Gigaspora margarita]
TNTNDLFDTEIYNAEPQDIIQISDNNMATNTSAISDKNSLLDISNIICSICKNKFSVATSTSTLYKHLDTQHPCWITKPELKEIRQLVGEGEATPLIRYNNNLNKYKLILQEESDLQAITQFLNPFYETTNVLFGSIYMTLGISIVLMDSIVDTISLYLQNPTSLEFLKVAATQMLTKVQKYTNKIYDKIAFMAAILDPRIKLELMPEDMNNKANYEFNQTVLSMNIDPLDWWKLNCTCFPNLSQMAKDYLAIQSILVSSKQVFSKAGDT